MFNIQICQGIVRLNYAFHEDIGRRALLPFYMLPRFFWINNNDLQFLWSSLKSILIVGVMLCNLSAVMQRAVHCNLIARVCQLSLPAPSLICDSGKLANGEIKVPRWPPSSPHWPPGPCPWDLYQHSRVCRHFIMLTAYPCPVLTSRTFEDCIIIIPGKRANICIKHVITQLSFIILSSLRTAQNISRMDGYQEPFIQEVECEAGMHPSWLKFWEYFRFLWKMRQIAPAATDKTCLQVCKEKRG